MAKKHWIMLKRGLSADPKHREKIGMALWCFMHIIDRADFETGKVFDWRDKDEAEDMGINERTLRDWRQKLVNEGYIQCVQKQRGLEIIIYNWVNPREYSTGPVNIKGDTKTAPSEFLGDTQGDTQPDTQVSRENVTPTYDSESRNQVSTKKRALDFSSMTVKEAYQVPTLKLFKDATDFFPGSPVWQYIHETITEKKLTFKQIHDANEAWFAASFKQGNIKGILEWAANGIPEKYQLRVSRKTFQANALPAGMRELDDMTPMPSVTIQIGD